MDLIREKLKLLPTSPGCYLMKDRQGVVIYVGKAKNLSNRVRSYFTGSHDGKTQRLVQEIVDFEYILTQSDLEALVLELNLIKRYDPKYNIMLKDDKSYPYIKITNERYPRLLITREVKRGKGKYFGPYPNATAAQETKKLLDRMYPFRKCRTLPKEVCLYYHIGQCLAPCVKDIPSSTYDEMAKEVTRFLRGGYKETKQTIEQKMYDASEQLDFERAKEYRDQLAHIEAVMERQSMTLNDFVDRDVFGYATKNGHLCVQVFFVRQGKLIEREATIFPYYKEPEEEMLTFIGQFYASKKHLKPQEIFVPLTLQKDVLEQLLDLRVLTPQRGKKADLVKVAIQNARAALDEKEALLERKYERTIGACEELGELLHIETPLRIEAFDNSHTYGSDPVSAMVQFVDGAPYKSGYRKYKLKEAGAHDDYGAMREVMKRRYVRLLKEGGPFPDLIVVDGGKGQLEIARELLEDELGLAIPLLGLAKDDRHSTNELLYGDPPEMIPISKRSEAFHLLTRIQEEVHRFAITFHREQRAKSAFVSTLDNIPGVGAKRKRQLLLHFGSIEAIERASFEALQRAGMPKNVAQAIVASFEK